MQSDDTCTKIVELRDKLRNRYFGIRMLGLLAQGEHVCIEM